MTETPLPPPPRIGTPAIEDSRFQRGFTLIELLVTLTILALLASIATPAVLKYIHSSRMQTAKLQVDSIAASLDLFEADTGRYPTTEEGLQALIVRPDNMPNWAGPYLKKGGKGLIDPWGVPYHYRIPGQQGDFDVFSFGDGKTDGTADETPQINNW